MSLPGHITGGSLIRVLLHFDVCPSDALGALLAVCDAPAARRGFGRLPAAPVEVFREDQARLHLRLAVSVGPTTDERHPQPGHVDGRFVAGRPSGNVLFGHLEAPIPNGLPWPECLRELLLQPVLHSHDHDLALRPPDLLHLAGGACPIRWRRRYHLARDRRRLRIRHEQFLIAGALEVPQRPAREVDVGLGPRGSLHAGERMAHTEEHDVNLSRATPLEVRVGPLRERAAERAVGAADFLEHLHGIGGAARRVHPRSSALRLQQLLAPLPNIKAERAFSAIALRQLLRRLPSAHNMMRYAIHQECYDRPKLE
mmetsp:Transcript_42730/g.123517  ORF Transcript_42730/g.123517 Transcript_42730/m.123517 type:complete len:313 (-) Transcript_42730:235-1173(-)